MALEEVYLLYSIENQMYYNIQPTVFIKFSLRVSNKQCHVNYTILRHVNYTFERCVTQREYQGEGLYHTIAILSRS